MSPLLMIRPVLEALNDGKVVRRAVAITLRVVAGLTALGSIFLIIEGLKLSFDMPTEGTVGGLLLVVIFAASIFAVLQILFYRAGTIEGLGDSPFTVIPIVSVLLRAIGEIYAALSAAVSAGGCLFIWLAKADPLWLLGGLGAFLPTMSVEGTFLGGLLFLLYFLFLGFALLILFYFLAESTVVLADIARNIRQLVQQTGGEPAA